MAKQKTGDVTKRLFVGGLAINITSEEISQRFSRFGKVTDLSLTLRKDDAGNPIKCFAHLNIEGDDAHIKKCFDAYQNTKWKGSVLKLQYAKESFVSRLKKEREELDQQNLTDTDPKPSWTPPVFEEIKGAAVPGTLIPGKKDWVVGKYGRILPILKVKKSSKTMKHDPSKLCHTAKMFKDDKCANQDEANCASLTWEINTPESEITKKRKGQFPDSGKTGRQNMKKTFKNNHDVSGSGIEKSVNNLKVEGFKQSVEDLEVVSQKDSKTPQRKPQSSVISNKFDSDLDSEGEDAGNQRTMSKSNNSREARIAGQGAPNLLSGRKTDAESFTTQNGSNKKKGKQNLWSEIPAFRGLSMLGIATVEENNNKPGLASGLENVTVSNNCLVDKVSVKEELSNGSNFEKPREESVNANKLRKRKRKCSKSEDLGDEESQNPSKVLKLSPSHMKSPEKSAYVHVKKTPNSEKLGVIDFLENSDNRDYASDDSVSSADSYEIIARKKRKLSDSNSFSSNKTMDTSREVSEGMRNQTGTMPKKPKLNRSLDESLSFSEFASGDLDKDQMDDVQPDQTARSDSDSGSHDSDLDDNDFELVAKKLAQKAGLMKPTGDKRKKSVQTAVSGSPMSSKSQPVFSKPKASESTVTTSSVTKQNEEEKKADANEKRLKALKEQMKNKQRQQAVMQKALKNLDSSDNTENKKIVFSSDEDEVEEKTDTSLSAVKKDDKVKSGPSLFEDSSDMSEDESDLEEMFKSKPQFEGKKGEKLMKLEQKIGDSRFKLDEKFVESGSEEEEESSDEEKDTADPLKEEKAASIKVLENVIGKSKLDQFTAKMKRNTKQMIDMNTVRFDPTKLVKTSAPSLAKTDELKQKRTETEKVILKTGSDQRDSGYTKLEKGDAPPKPKKMEFLEPAKEKKRKHEVDKETEINEKSKKAKSEKSKAGTETSKKSKVEMSSSLVSLFKGGDSVKDDAEQSFSLLSQFDSGDTDSKTNTDVRPLSGLFGTSANTKPLSTGEDTDESSEQDEESEEEESSSSDEKEELSDKDDDEHKEYDNRLEDQSVSARESRESDSEVESYDEESSMEEEKESSSTGPSSSHHSEDKELRDAGRVDIRFTKEQWLEKWPELRSTIVRLYKKKHKDAVKSKKVHSEAKRRKDFLQMSKKSHWFRRKK